ncbi:MAG: hypothetical protein ACYDD2_16925 [Candidatus Acidiferrales bacterium]
MKKALIQVSEALQDLAIRVTAIESELIDSGKVKREDLETFRITGEQIAMKKLANLRSAIYSLPDDAA